jgi:hypothetical protein
VAEQKKAGAFDIRIVIAALVGIYGIVLTILGLTQSDSELDKSDGLNINLWGGLAMVVFAAAFVAWARWRPIVVPPDVDKDDEPPLNPH